MKFFFLCFLIFFFSAVLTLPAQSTVKDSLYSNAIGDSIVNYAKTFLGIKYTYASASPKAGFDCSGLTWFVFKHYGFAIPRSAKDYKNLGTDIPIALARKGDIIVFRGTHKGDRTAGHVGIVISNPGEPVQFIHASSSKNHSGVIITDYYSSNYPNRFIKIVRVLK